MFSWGLSIKLNEVLVITWNTNRPWEQGRNLSHFKLISFSYGVTAKLSHRVGTPSRCTFMEHGIIVLSLVCIYQVKVKFWHVCKLCWWIFTFWTYRCIFWRHFCKLLNTCWNPEWLCFVYLFSWRLFYLSLLLPVNMRLHLSIPKSKFN